MLDENKSMKFSGSEYLSSCDSG